MDNSGNKKFKLDGLKGKAQYKMPDTFFKQLKNDIESQTFKDSKKKQLRYYNYWWVAASLVFIFTFFYFYNNGLDKKNEVNDLLTGVTDEEIIQYLTYSELENDVLYDAVEYSANEENTLLPSDLTTKEIEYTLEYYSL